MILIALFVFLLVVIVVLQSYRIDKLEVGQKMEEEAIDNLYEIVFPDEECDMCGDIIEEQEIAEDREFMGALDAELTKQKKPKKTTKKAKKPLTKSKK